MLLAGLTGSIGMGKTTTAAMFSDLGAPVFDADAAVHRLYAPKGAAVRPVEEAFPGTTGPEGVNRTALRDQLQADTDGFSRLERIVHPLVARERRRLLRRARRHGAPFVILDIPLLFETGADERMDAVIVVTAPADVQRRRVLARPGMTANAFEAILARQTPDAQKRAGADFIVDTSRGKNAARRQVRRIARALKRRNRRRARAARRVRV